MDVVVAAISSADQRSANSREAELHDGATTRVVLYLAAMPKMEVE